MVYNSSSKNTSDFVYVGDDKSNCTLFIQNVKFNYSGLYKFRFITNDDEGKWTGDPGVNLTVSDLKVELIRLSGNGTLKPGDSLNLTCHVNCTHSSSQIVWSKNNQNLDRSGPVLQFPNLTVEDSGSYTCTWSSSVGLVSDTISIQVEGRPISSGTPLQWLTWIILGVTGGILIVVVVVAVHYNRRRRKKASEEKSGPSEEKTQGEGKTHGAHPKRDPQPDQPDQPDEEVINQNEVTYASVHIKNKKANKKRKKKEEKRDEEVNEDGVMYASVCVQKKKTTNQGNVQDDQQDDSVIYSDVKLH
ncbi:CD276 antigen homolog [Trichomycterus rosablanca]|uniref:CD276 antigen homolog n=1 Tax=Trichomycterus rosablanca TaxID=2290929 RepID=UPI002F35701E